MLFTRTTECAIVPRVSCFLKRLKDIAEPRKFEQDCTCVVYTPMMTVIASLSNQESSVAGRFKGSLQVVNIIYLGKGAFGADLNHGSQELGFLHLWCNI